MATNGLPPTQIMKHDHLFTEAVAIIRDYMTKYSDRNSKVIEFKQPDELKKLIDFDLRAEGESTDTILDLIRKAFHYSVHTVHPRFYNQLFSGVDEVGMVGMMLSAATNTSMYTFEMAPVYSLMEAEVLKKMRELVGWSSGDGILSPGGSISNLYGLLVARYEKFPETKRKGTQGLPQMVIFSSEQCHYSAAKAAIIMGIGTDNVIAVKCNEKGQMIPEDLDRKVTEATAKGLVTLAVIATAGTTVLGAFDPIDRIAAVCEKYSIWLHVDGAFGAAALLSRTHRGLLTGIERADSVTWNPHKVMCVPLQCSAILFKQEDKLAPCLTTKADYLFQQDKMNYDVSYDTGDKSIQCGRLNDILKIWLMWKERGTSGFERQVDNAMAMTRYLADRIKAREGFELVIEPEYLNIPFWYYPPSLRNCTDPKEKSRRLAKVAPLIKAEMVIKGTIMMNYQPMPSQNLPNFLRMTVVTQQVCKEDMDFVLDEVERIGKDLDV